MKKSILDQFASDAISAPVAITGGTGKCVKKTGSHGSRKSGGSNKSGGSHSRKSGGSSGTHGGGGKCAPKPKTPKICK